MSDRDELVSQFCNLTSAAPHEAQNYLGAAEWNLEAAVTEYFTSQEEEADMGDGEQPAEPSAAPVPGGGRTLGGDGAPSVHVPATQSGGTAPSSGAGATGGASTQKKKFGSLRDLAGGPAQPGSDDDDLDDDPDLYAGGEKSGLAVQNPDDLKRKILEKAKRQQGRQRDEPQETRQTAFTGRAQTLGGDDAPSRIIDDPNPTPAQGPPRAERTLHFWANGFSVDDGPLYRNDDPQNAERLEMIRRGRAPYDILNVGYDQEADVKLEQHEGPYVQPKRKFVPFSGQGQRLGSPTPGVSGVVEPPPQPAAAPSASQAAEAPKMDVDDSQPTVSIQIRLGDGTRLVSRFNATHTIGDIYGFVSSANPASQSRSWVLMTTFPSKELKDKSQVLGELSDFKRGGTVVQKWT